jgi:predicted HAD superfamily Cof-like phosphohydrolase
MKSTIDKVAEFHEMTGQPILNAPAIPSTQRWALRIRLIQEELNELAVAFDEGNLVEVADALTDLQYVLDGTYLECGMKDIKGPLFDEVQRSNMSKSCTKETITNELYNKRNEGIDCTWSERNGHYMIVRHYDGKILKPSTYSPADLASIVAGKVLAGA